MDHSESRVENLPHPRYRPDIDGLRAIAILSVVGYHAFPERIRGGFIGVDVFFVLSGFLISSIIMGGLQTGRFSFVEFYVRRIRRIFPGLLLVLIASLVLGWNVLFADEYMQLGKHIAGGAGFVSNFLLWSESGYFDSAAAMKPLLHLWSLGIEEQYYVIWPLLLWLLWEKRVNLFTVIIVIGATSFALNAWEVHRNPTADFYSPQTRFWELMVGSALAYLQLYRGDLASRTFDLTGTRHNPIWSNLSSLVGLGLIFFGVHVITQNRSFPGWWALSPTLGTALVISAGEVGRKKWSPMIL